MKEDLRDWCKSRCCNDSGSMIRDGALKKGLEDMHFKELADKVRYFKEDETIKNLDIRRSR